MVTLMNDELVLTSPATERALQSCAAAYRAEWLPRILAEDPRAALAKVLESDYSWLPAETKQAAASRVDAMTPEQFEAEFARQVSACMEEGRARLGVSFQRTLRLPDDGKVYPLPPGLGRFPLRPIQPYAARVPASWASRGGVLMPIHQAEALWLSFNTGYGWALQIGTGLLNAVNGLPWRPGLRREPQSYVVLPDQPWLDGYGTGDGEISQFVAARMGQGYTAAEQLLPEATSGLQLEAFPLKAEVWFARRLEASLPKSCANLIVALIRELAPPPTFYECCAAPAAEMGLGAGGRMRQQIYEDPWAAGDWDATAPVRVWVHLCDALAWVRITGARPPQEPPTAKEYASYRLPWFDYYRDDIAAIEGSSAFAKLKTVFTLAKKSGDASIPQEETVDPGPVISLGAAANPCDVAEWDGQ